jgi:hypothetical protein
VLRAGPRHVEMRICRAEPLAGRGHARRDMAVADGTARAPLFGFSLRRAVLAQAQAGEAGPLMALIDAIQPSPAPCRAVSCQRPWSLMHEEFHMITMA